MFFVISWVLSILNFIGPDLSVQESRSGLFLAIFSSVSDYFNTSCNVSSGLSACKYGKGDGGGGRKGAAKKKTVYKNQIKKKKLEQWRILFGRPPKPFKSLKQGLFPKCWFLLGKDGEEGAKWERDERVIWGFLQASMMVMMMKKSVQQNSWLPWEMQYIAFKVLPASLLNATQCHNKNSREWLQCSKRFACIG